MITVRFFAMLKGLAGVESAQYDIKAPVTVGELKSMLKKDFPGLAGMLDSRSLLVSVNQEFARNGTSVNDGDEVGFLPPFSGG